VRLTGLVHRAHHPRWSWQPTSGEGAARHGGRFNPKGLPALYTSRRLETAWLEAQQAFPFKAQPMTMVAYHVDCTDMFDLTDAAERDRLGIAIADLACAKRLIEKGAAGIIAPSFAAGAGPDDVNVVFWRWADVAPHQVSVIDDTGRLPRDDRSWR
jgi:RES domain-containing protein